LTLAGTVVCHAEMTAFDIPFGAREYVADPFRDMLSPAHVASVVHVLLG
jgi:hypothetical protein